MDFLMGFLWLFFGQLLSIPPLLLLVGVILVLVMASRATTNQAGPPSDRLSPVGERVVADTMRRFLASMPPQTPERVAELEQHARDLVLRREQAGEVFVDPGEA